MDKRVREWLKQADYDFETARYMDKGGRYFYAVFMCHLAVEKALKGLYQHRLKKTPPRTHNLIYLSNQIGEKPDAPMAEFLSDLNEAQIKTRYPDRLEKAIKTYDKKLVMEILQKTEEVLEWIKKQF